MGLLAMAYAYSHLGLLLGVIVTCAAAICSGWSLWFLYRFAVCYKVKTYPELGFRVFGKAGEIGSILMMFFLVLCPVTGFLMVSGNALSLVA
jgi:amino acid permease